MQRRTGPSLYLRVEERQDTVAVGWEQKDAAGKVSPTADAYDTDVFDQIDCVWLWLLSDQ